MTLDLHWRSQLAETHDHESSAHENTFTSLKHG